MTEQIDEEQKVTHYLTYFNVFTSEKIFQDYQSFLEKLVIQLGEDWRIESNILWDGQQNGQGYPHIFNIFLSVFLENTLRNQYSPGIFTHYDEMAQQQKSKQKFNSIKNASKTNQTQKQKQIFDIGHSLTFQTLSVGFFVTATEIWNSIFPEKRHFMRNKQNAEIKPFATSIECQPSQTIKKLRKLSNDVAKNIKSRLQNSQFVSHSESRFSREAPSSNILSKVRQNAKNVTWKSFKPSQDQISPVTLNKIRDEIQNRQIYTKWQVLSNFMVNILEIQSKTKNQSIRLIKVNKQFYHTATLIWLLISNKKNYSMKYTEYQVFTMSILADHWRSSYSPILRLLFQILTKEWNQITKQYAINLNDDYEVMKIFIQRLRKALQSAWNSVLSQINLQLLQI